MVVCYLLIWCGLLLKLVVCLLYLVVFYLRLVVNGYGCVVFAWITSLVYLGSLCGEVFGC